MEAGEREAGGDHVGQPGVKERPVGHLCNPWDTPLCRRGRTGQGVSGQKPGLLSQEVFLKASSTHPFPEVARPGETLWKASTLLSFQITWERKNLKAV